MRIANFKLKPASESFPIEQIGSHLKSLDHIAVDPVSKSLFVMAPPGKIMSNVLGLRERTGDFCGCTVIKVEPESVEVCEVGPENKAYCRAFAQWMMDTFDCMVLDDYGYDVTERVHRDAAVMFPPSKVEP